MNPLKEMLNILTTSSNKRTTARVIGKEDQKLLVTLSSGARKTVWGAAKLGDSVLLEEDKVIAVVSHQDRVTIVVP